MLGRTALRMRDASGKVVPLETKEGGWVPYEQRQRALRDHPEAFFVLEVPHSAIWQPPDEPGGASGWHWKPAVLRAHRAKVRRSLESFLNDKLSELDEMVRTGWFIIKRASA